MPMLPEALDTSPLHTAYLDAGNERLSVERTIIPRQVADAMVPPESAAQTTRYRVLLQRGPAAPVPQLETHTLDEVITFLRSLPLPSFDADGDAWRPATPATGDAATVWTDNPTERGIPPLNPLDEGAPKVQP